VKLFVGLGNPDKQYQYTRHNIGFRILETFIIRNIGLDQKWKKGFSSQFFQCHLKGEKTIFAKPQTYMNLSGKSVEKMMNYYGISNHQLLVVYDDIHLSLGNIRIRKQGSSGGHKGIESIISALATEEFPRLRIGIRNDLLLQQMDYPSFVLSRFLPEEEQVLEKIINRAVRALEDIIDFGYEYAMREYNRLEEKKSDQG